MSVSLSLQRIVRGALIREYHRRGQYSFREKRNQGFFVTVGNYFSDDCSLSLKHSRNRDFSNRPATLNLALADMLVHVLSLATEKALIRFYLSAKWIAVFVKHQSDLFEHAPCGLVGHACLTFKLLCGDTAASRCHQIDRVEPCTHRRGRLVIDRARGRVYVMSAELARVRLARRYFVMLRDRFALIAKDAIGIKIVFQPFKASIIGREILFEILECVTLHLRAFNFLLFCHARILTEWVPTVKG